MRAKTARQWVLFMHTCKSIQLGLAMVALRKFYKVNSLAMATRISYNYQVLLNEGNRIVIPQGVLIFFSCLEVKCTLSTCLVKKKYYFLQHRN